MFICIEAIVENLEEKLQYQRIVAKIIAFTKPPGKTLLLYPKNNSSIVNSFEDLR